MIYKQVNQIVAIAEANGPTALLMRADKEIAMRLHKDKWDPNS